MKVWMRSSSTPLAGCTPKVGLMDELGKVKRVVEKQAPVSEVLLVLDATTGQNGLTQARVFADVVDVTGIVLTKLDGTAKGRHRGGGAAGTARAGQVGRAGRRPRRPGAVRTGVVRRRAARLTWGVRRPVADTLPVRIVIRYSRRGGDLDIDQLLRSRG